MGKRVGSYELKSKLGKGTFGTVYLGKHLPSRNKIAIKMISRQGLRQDQQNRLEQEILCQRSVESEHIVKLIDVQKTDNNFYLILEYCAGGDLGQFMQENGPVEEPVAQRWMQQLISGLKALKEKSIIHRDLKLQNILMSENSTSAVLKLADFGMSRFLEDDLAQSWLGTPLYMAPELFTREGGYDMKADVWSLGIVFFEMLTGEAPFRAKRKEEIPRAQKELKPLPSNLSALCQDLLQKMLTYNSKQRISLDELFEHPFIKCDSQDDLSIKASRGSSEANLSEASAVNPFNESTNQDYTEDFVILDNEESCTDFVFLAKDNHPAVNFSEVSHTVEGLIETSFIIFRLADKIKEELLGSFALYVKGTILVAEALQFSQDIIEKHNLTRSTQPSFFDQFDKAKELFLDFESKTEELYKEVEILLSAHDIARLHWVYSVGPQGLADSLIFNYTINICKEAAHDEYIKNLQASKERYQEAVVLLDLLCKNKDKTKSEDWEKLEAFRTETRRRLDTVNVKLATA
mmetsp:Transcript_8615/g.12774  ORF Transcript_8615/g.12774 Transcript_8615/m.12774 type:complete len:520 (+) Transcript_8615:2369-3928(+)